MKLTKLKESNKKLKLKLQEANNLVFQLFISLVGMCILAILATLKVH